MVLSLHLLGEPVHLSPGVAVDDGLCNGQGGVEIAQGVELALLALDGNVELLDTLQGQLISLDEDADGVAHELGGDLQHLQEHGGTEDGALHGLGHVLEHVVDLLLEATGKHLIGLIEDEELHVVQLEGAALDHVVDTARGTHNHVHAVLKGTDVLTHGGTTHASVDFDAHEVTKGRNDLDDLLGELTGRSQDQGLAVLDPRVEALKDTDGEGGSLTGTCVFSDKAHNE